MITYWFVLQHDRQTDGTYHIMYSLSYTGIEFMNILYLQVYIYSKQYLRLCYKFTAAMLCLLLYTFNFSLSKFVHKLVIIDELQLYINLYYQDRCLLHTPGPGSCRQSGCNSSCSLWKFANNEIGIYSQLEKEHDRLQISLYITFNVSLHYFMALRFVNSQCSLVVH